MNKLTPIIFLLSFGLYANAQVPNGSFENWANYPILSLKDWSVFGNTNRTDDAFSGNYALELRNSEENNTYGILAKAVIGASSLSGGEPYSDIPNVISFRVKYNLAVGEIGRFLLVLRKNGQDIGGYYGSFEGTTADSFMHFREAIAYTDNVVPDTIIIMVTSKDFDEPSVKGDGFLIIDDIRLENFGDPSTAIKNNDFEDWDVQNISHPEEWYTTDIYIYETVGIIPPMPLVQQSSDAFNGSKALLLRNRQFGPDILPGIALTGNFEAFDQPTFPLNQRREFFTGKYKYNSTLDSATILVRLFKNGFPISTGYHVIPPAIDTDFKTFGFRLNYTVQTTPDSASIVIACANGDHPKGANTSLIVDQLEFVDQLVGIDNRIPTTFQLYPNPTTGSIHFSENVEKGEIWNMFGQKMMTFENVQTIDITTLTSQMYLIKIENNNQIWIQKISKQ